MDCEGHGITLPKWYDLGAALHAWPLLRQDELAACEVDAGLGEKNCDLDRKCDIAVEILVEAVEITRNILQQKRSRPRLACSVTSLEKRGVVDGIALLDSHPAVPFIGYACEVRIERCSKIA
jgi:hypothetical protein